MSLIDRSEALIAAYSRLRQFARYSVGRMFGTTTAAHPGYRHMLDLGESKLAHRAEINALTKVLQDKGIVTQAEWGKFLEEELVLAEKDQRELFPEVTPAADGRSFSLDVAASAKRMREEGWPR